MNSALLLTHFNRIIDAPDSIPRLRKFILDLAVRGKLVEQDSRDEPASRLLARIQAEQRLKQNSTALRADCSKAIQAEETPFAIPTNWHWARLGERLELVNGRAFKPTDWLPKGLPIVRIQNLNDESAPFNYCAESTIQLKHIIDSGSFLISWSGTPGTSFGAFIWHRGRAALNQHIFACFQKGGAYFDRFLQLAINGRLDEMIEKAHGGVGLQHITKGKLEYLPLPLPPLSEQHRIVAKVDELMALCDRLDAVRSERDRLRDRLTSASQHYLNSDADTKAAGRYAGFYVNHLPTITSSPEQIPALREGILNLAVRGRIVLQDENDEPVSTLLARIHVEQQRLIKAGAIPKSKVRLPDSRGALASELPKAWESVALGRLCNIVTSGSRGWAEYYSESGPKFIRAQNIRFGKLRLDDLACVNPPKKSEGMRTQVSEGDLLVVITGAGVTNPALLQTDLGEAYVSQHVALIKPTDTTLSAWLLLCLMAPLGGRAELVTRAYGAGKPGLNLDNIRSLTIPLPPLAEQRRIIAKVDALMAICDQLETTLSAKHCYTSRLLEAVVHSALPTAGTPRDGLDRFEISALRCTS